VKRVTRSSARFRLVQRQRDPDPVIIGWCRPPLRARQWCPKCWADLGDLPHVDWCPRCRRTLLMDQQA
jgi:hypothetical protein